MMFDYIFKLTFILEKKTKTNFPRQSENMASSGCFTKYSQEKKNLEYFMTWTLLLIFWCIIVLHLQPFIHFNLMIQLTKIL